LDFKLSGKTKLTLDEIRELCTESSFERGVNYYKTGRVINIEQSGKRIIATVQGTDDYTVTIYEGNNRISATCTCPYDFEGYCKHIVATLIALSLNDNKVKVVNKKEKEDRSKVILNNLSLDELKMFLNTEFDKNQVFKENFIIYFSGKGVKTRNLRDYKKEIERSYRELSDRHGFIKYGMNVDFNKYYDLAERFDEAGNTLEAVTIFQALSEVIAENMENVDDSDGYYGGEFFHAIANMTYYLNKLELKHEEKKRHIEYFFNKYIGNEPDYFQEYYDFALREICNLKEDLKFWGKLLKPYLSEKIPDNNQWTKYYQAIHLLSMELYILDSLNDKEGFYQLIQKCYKKDHDFCLYYAFRLEKDGQHQKAIEIAEEGLTLFPPHLSKEIRKFLNHHYKIDSPEKYKQNLVSLFIENQDWDDYYNLKKVCSEKEWQEIIFPLLINSLSEGYTRGGIVTDLYLKENMFEQALQRVLSQKSIYSLSLYHRYLAEKYPEKYFYAYLELIIPFADSTMGRTHYRRIVTYLKQMKKIRGFEAEFDKLICLLKTKYANRPAFLDEMKYL